MLILVTVLQGGLRVGGALSLGELVDLLERMRC